MNRKKCVYFDNDPTIINVYLKKDVAVQISKRKCTLGSYKAFPFFCQKTVFLYFENIVILPNAPLDVEIGLHRP